MMMPLLEKLIGRGTDQVVFLGRANKPMTRFGIHRLVTHYAGMASDEMPSLQTKRVSPHNIRHTTAVHRTILQCSSVGAGDGSGNVFNNFPNFARALLAISRYQQNSTDATSGSRASRITGHH
jgi:hypothetical protein